MFSRFFINHPIFASCIAIVIAFAGLVAIRALPIEQYPNMTPPLIQLTAIYNGANADTMANDVASPLEQQILGAENMIYMYSQNSSTGNMTLDVYFNIGTDPDIAQVNVQNLANQAFSQLPEPVQQEGLNITKQTPNILMVVAINSPDGEYDEVFTSNYTSINVVNELDLLPGISKVQIIGQRNYSMRIWLKPDRMAELGISAQDVIHAVQEQNKDFGIGQLGQAPNPHPVPLTIPMTTLGRLTSPEEFENIIIRAELNGSMVLLKDIAEVNLGAQDYSVDGSVNAKPTTLIAVFQQYGANALDVAQDVRTKMDQLSKNFPAGLEYYIPYDTTLFIKASISEVIRTVFEAALLVVIVVFIFLHQLRATLIPFLALVVSILGTFAGLYVLGYSINLLTLFAMVLAIGIVVDDAIVVVENVERNLKKHNLSPKEAAFKAMQEVSNPIIAIVFVLCAVFIPIAFLGGIAGQLYRQFGITIAISVALSGLVALSLSPAIAALVLKPNAKPSRFSHWFNNALEKLTAGYIAIASWFLRHVVISVLGFCAILGAIFLFFKTTPTSFVPNEDQGYLIVLTSLPDGASLNRTAEISQKLEHLALKHPGVERVISFSGFSLLESLDRTNISTQFLNLTNWDKRNTPALSAAAIAKDLNEAFFQVEGARSIVVNPPAIQGLGTVGGFEFWIENRGDGGSDALKQALETFIEKAKDEPALTPLHTSAEFDNMQFFVDLNRYKARALGVNISDVFQTLQTFLGAVYVNNFNKFGRVYQVIVQAEPKYRERLEDFENLYVRSSHDEMVPLKSLVQVHPTSGPNLISRFNDYPAAQIIGGANPGFSSGEAIRAMVRLAKEHLPSEMEYGWSGEVYEALTTGGSSFTVLLAGMFMVFLILAALYESWSIPMAILFAIPFGFFGSFAAIWLKGMPNDIYFQIGLVTLVALSAKNAILIVEFAVQKVKEGVEIGQAALEAAALRFRAIIMTSLTFIFGVMPLIFSKGAGAASRLSVGMGVLGGMISATLFTLCFIPLFFTLIFKLKKRLEKKES